MSNDQAPVAPVDTSMWNEMSMPICCAMSISPAHSVLIVQIAANGKLRSPPVNLGFANDTRPDRRDHVDIQAIIGAHRGHRRCLPRSGSPDHRTMRHFRPVRPPISRIAQRNWRNRRMSGHAPNKQFFMTARGLSGDSKMPNGMWSWITACPCQHITWNCASTLVTADQAGRAPRSR